MEKVLLTDIKLSIDEEILDKFHICDEEDTSKALKMVAEANSIGRPKAAYKVCYVDSKQDSEVVIENIVFTSKILRVNLGDAYKVFPFLATCGTELKEWADSFDDILEHYWAEQICETALHVAIRELQKHLKANQPGKTSAMNPGSLKDWPIEQQIPLFRLLGPLPSNMGVELTRSNLMIPAKSVSGIRFPSETDFQNCQLCTRNGCPGRRAPFDEHLYNDRYDN